MPRLDKDFQSPKQRLFFEYLKKNCPQFGLFYSSPEICPKGYLEIFSRGFFRRKLATLVIDYDDEGYYFFAPMVSRQNRKTIISAIKTCPLSCRLDLHSPTK